MMTLLESIQTLYQRLRLDSYRRMLGAIREKDGSLSATEAFSADVIHLLGTPTLQQFANAIGISQPNATYKVNSLVAKGYVCKQTAESDRREVRLTTGEKFRRYLQERSRSLERAAAHLRRRYTDEELALTADVVNALLTEMEREEQTDD